jgi:hypothetical protein
MEGFLIVSDLHPDRPYLLLLLDGSPSVGTDAL